MAASDAMPTGEESTEDEGDLETAKHNCAQSGQKIEFIVDAFGHKYVNFRSKIIIKILHLTSFYQLPNGSSNIIIRLILIKI